MKDTPISTRCLKLHQFLSGQPLFANVSCKLLHVVKFVKNNVLSTNKMRNAYIVFV